MPPVTHKPTSKLVRSSRAGWGGVQLKTSGVEEPATGATSSIDANRLPSSIKIYICDEHVVGKFTSKIKQLVEVRFSVTLLDGGGILEAFDSIGLVGVEDGIVQTSSSVRCDKPEVVEVFLAASLTRLELSVQQILARGVQGRQRSAGKSENGEDRAEVHGCSCLIGGCVC